MCVSIYIFTIYFVYFIHLVTPETCCNVSIYVWCTLIDYLVPLSILTAMDTETYALPPFDRECSYRLMDARTLQFPTVGDVLSMW